MIEELEKDDFDNLDPKVKEFYISLRQAGLCVSAVFPQTMMKFLGINWDAFWDSLQRLAAFCWLTYYRTYNEKTGVEGPVLVITHENSEDGRLFRENFSPRWTSSFYPPEDFN